MKGFRRRKRQWKVRIKKNFEFNIYREIKKIHPLRAEYFLKEILREQGRAIRN